MSPSSFVPPPAPLPFGYTVYTKQNCRYCTLLKTWLLAPERSGVPIYLVPCDEFLVDPDTKTFFLRWLSARAGVPWTTFPAVFYNGQFVGGYQDTVGVSAAAATAATAATAPDSTNEISFDEWSAFSSP
jgi:glutaredoxin